MSIREKALSALALLAVVCAPNAASTTPRLPVATDKAAANNEVKVIDETILIPYSQAATPSAEFGNALSKARSDKENHSGKSPSFSSGAYGDHFTWGADAGSSIDMSATDMSTIDLNINVGYKGPYVRFLGIGAGISTMVDNSSTPCSAPPSRRGRVSASSTSAPGWPSATSSTSRTRQISTALSALA